MEIAPNRNTLIVHLDQGKNRISRHLYGQFAEHLGTCIYEGLWVGPDSPIPNTNGIRQDVVAALLRIGVPVLRWPGGCFADEYHWMDGIGPRENRPTSINTHWGGVTENNHFGAHEFLELCRQLECEPYICGNLGSGTVREMQQWVEYLTDDGRGPMADLRHANGREDPWRIQYWGVGNENWGCGGNMRPEFYADLFRRYATYLRNFGANRLFKIACGGTDVDVRWTEVLMREAAKCMDGLSLHSYILPGNWESKGSAVGFSEQDWFAVMRKSLAFGDMIARHAAVMDRFDPGKRVGLMVDEWGTWYDPSPGSNPGFLQQQNTLRDALSAGVVLHAFHDHCDRVRMANIAQMVNVLQAMIRTRGAEMHVTPTGHVFSMFQPHREAIRLPVSLRPARYRFGRDAISAVSASASLQDDGSVCLSLCNLDPENSQLVECELRGGQPAAVSGRILTGSAMDSHNTFEDPDAVIPRDFEGAALHGSRLEIQLPPKSVVVLQMH